MLKFLEKDNSDSSRDDSGSDEDEYKVSTNKFGGGQSVAELLERAKKQEFNVCYFEYYSGRIIYLNYLDK